MRKSLGSKRKELAPEHIREIAHAFSNFMEVDETVVLERTARKGSV